MTKALIAPARSRGRPANANTRNAIITVAMKLFMAHGVHATTMEEIARTLSISKHTLYSRFPSKDELFAAVIAAKCEHYFPEFMFQGLSERPVKEVLYSIAEGLMQLLLSDDVVAMERILMNEAESQPHLIKLFYDTGPRRMKELVSAQMAYWHQSRQLHVPNAALATELFCALIKGSDMVFQRSMRLSPKPSQRKFKAYCQAAVDSFITAHSPR